MLSGNRKITFYLFISVVIHLLLFFIMRDVWQKFAARPVPEPQTLWVNLRQVESEKLPIADIQKPAVEEKPEAARAQSLYDQKVDEETVQPSAARDEPQRGQKPVHAPKTKEYALKHDRPRLPEAAPPKTIPGMPDAARDEGHIGAADDFLPHYKVGKRTYINTHANPNIRYFVELKRKFRLTFNPGGALRGHLYEISRGKIDVVIGVSVNEKGELADSIIIRSSGLDTYDREGLRTVRSSSPFSAPPAELLADDTLLHMAWTFVVYL